MLEYLIIIHIILYGALADNPTLLQVAHNRQYLDVAAPIPASVDVDGYSCRVALPNRFVGLIGREVYFYNNGIIFGPWLVTDIQSDTDSVTQPMEAAGIAADVDCPQFAHRRGWVFTVERWAIH